MAVNIHITIIELNALHTKRQNLYQELDAVIHLLMEDKHWGLRKSRNARSLNSRFKSLDTFFFQAEDGIRGFHVTGVQTCALPIWIGHERGSVLSLHQSATARGTPTPTPRGSCPAGRTCPRRRRRARRRAVSRSGPCCGSPAQIGRASCRERV